MGKNKVLVQVGTKPLWVAGEDTFIGEMVKFWFSFHLSF
jgi:ABC-type Fe3+-hydroxamate transport system substrate-binding protein